MELDEFLDTMSEQIRNPKVGVMAREEMENHIRDQAQAYEEMGMGRDEAISKAVGQMGDPVTTGMGAVCMDCSFQYSGSGDSVCVFLRSGRDSFPGGLGRRHGKLHKAVRLYGCGPGGYGRSMSPGLQCHREICRNWRLCFSGDHRTPL